MPVAHLKESVKSFVGGVDRREAENSKGYRIKNFVIVPGGYPFFYYRGGDLVLSARGGGGGGGRRRRGGGG